LISPGPCTPKEAGIFVDVIKTFGGKIPLLGVCLGHQSMGDAFGGRIVRAKKLMHGKTSSITHDGKGVFKGLKNPLTATRYHSLVIEKKNLSERFNCYGHQRRRRNHGRAASISPGVGRRSISPREHSHRMRQRSSS
jgi:anthranilate synthase/aminodeoxychorismate synthase-like glutamine amidotransferase